MLKGVEPKSASLEASLPFSKHISQNGFVWHLPSNRKVNYFVEAKKAKVLKAHELQSSPNKKLNIGSFVKRFA